MNFNIIFCLYDRNFEYEFNVSELAATTIVNALLIEFVIKYVAKTKTTTKI